MASPSARGWSCCGCAARPSLPPSLDREGFDSDSEALSPLKEASGPMDSPASGGEEDDGYEPGEPDCCGCEHPKHVVKGKDIMKGFTLFIVLIMFTAVLVSLQGFMGPFFTLLPLWSAAILTMLGSTCMPTMRPNMKWILFWAPLFSLGEIGFFRGYVVSCRRQWKEQVLQKETSGAISVFSETALTAGRTAADLFNCAEFFEERDNWPADKKDWCCHKKSIGCQRRLHAANGRLLLAVGPAAERAMSRTAATSSVSDDDADVVKAEAEAQAAQPRTTRKSLGAAEAQAAEATTTRESVGQAEVQAAGPMATSKSAGEAKAQAAEPKTTSKSAATSVVPNDDHDVVKAQAAEPTTPSKTEGPAVAAGPEPTKAKTPGLSIVANDLNYRDVDDHVVAAYCDIGQNKDFGTELPILKHCADEGSLCAKLFNWPCYPWTCMYTAQHDRGGYKLLLLFLVSALLSAIYLLNPCHSKLAHDCCGFGEYHTFVVWYWVVYFPTFGIQVATFMKGVSYTDIWKNLFEIVQLLMKDAYMMSMTAGCVLIFIIIACNWSKITASLGLDDAAFIRLDHIGDAFGFQMATSSGEFQICVFRVEATQTVVVDESTSPPPASTSSSRFSGFWSRSSEGKKQEKHIRGHDRPYNMYVRIGYGENAPQHSRVVSGTRLLTTAKINIRQAFNLNRMHGMNDSPLFITVLNQAVLSSDQLGRVIFTPHHLKNMLDDAQAREDHEKQENGGRECLAIRQLSEMLKSPPNINALKALGFQWFPLDSGGTIVLAFAPAP